MNWKSNVFRAFRRGSGTPSDRARPSTAPGSPAAPALVEQLEDRRLMAAGTTRMWVEAGNSTSYTDTSGKVWGADRGFLGGSVSSTSYAVANTNDDKLYYTRRFGAFTYSLPATNGDYTLRLLFADPAYTTAGKRKFHVTAEGTRILSDFDIAANGGGRAALAKSFRVTIADGRLNLAFQKGSLDNPIVSAIELLPYAAPAPQAPAPPTGLAATLAAGPRIDLRWNDVSANETFFRVERSVNGGTFAVHVQVPQNTTAYSDTAVKPGNTYVYRVRAGNATAVSNPSNGTSVTIPQSPAPAPSLTWAGSTAAPVARVEPGGIQVGSKLYIWGGFQGGGGYVVHNRFDVFDMATQTWSTRRPAPAPQTHAALATDGRYIYAAGGQYGGGIPGTPSADVWRYDTVYDTWSAALPDLPEARYGGGMGLLNNRLYFFGGNRPDRTTVAHNLWTLDLANPTPGWSARASLPAGMAGDHISTAVVNGKIYAAGGEHGHAAHEDDGAPYIQHNYLLEYNPATNAWVRKADLPDASSHHEAATLVVNGKIVVLGGQINDIKVTPVVRVYDPATNAWSVLTPLPERRKGGVAGYLNGKLFYTGGQRDGDFLVSTQTWAGTLTGI